MICPYCGKEMEQGRLMGVPKDLDFLWLPQDVKPPLIYNNFYSRKIEEQGGLQLNAEHSWLKRSYLEVFLCRACQKGIFSYSAADTPAKD